MVRADVISLVSETPGAHGIFDPPSEVERTVFCTVKSVGYNEFYAAQAAGIEPSVVFNLTNAEDYAGEKIVVWNEVRYRVVRTYLNGMGIDITCELATTDRKGVTPSGDDTPATPDAG